MVHHHPNKVIQNHLEHNLENISYGMWLEMNPLNLSPKNQQYYLLQVLNNIVTRHLLHLLKYYSHIVHLLDSLLETNDLFSCVISSHNANIPTSLKIWIYPSYTFQNSL